MARCKPFEVPEFGHSRGKGGRQLKELLLVYMYCIKRLREWLPRNEREKDRFYGIFLGQRKIIRRLRIRIINLKKINGAKQEKLSSALRKTRVTRDKLIRAKKRPIRVRRILEKIKIRVRSGHTRGSSLATVMSTALSHASLYNSMFHLELMKYAREVGISSTSMALLWYIKNFQHVTNKEMSQYLDLPLATLLSHIKPLYENDLVAHEFAKRVKISFITIKGKEVIVKFDKAVTARLKQRYEQNSSRGKRIDSINKQSQQNYQPGFRQDSRTGKFCKRSEDTEQ